MKRLFAGLIGLVTTLALASAMAVLPAVPASASPISYCNTPLDTVQNVINTCVLAPLNGTTNAGVPSAQYTAYGTSSSGAVTLNATRGQITTESLTTAHGAAFTDTLTDSLITASSIIFVMVNNGTSTTGLPCVGTVTPTAGQAVISIDNCAASAAFNGTLVYSFFVYN